MARIAWRELAADEVMAALQARAAAGEVAVSGFLDAYQWSQLTGLPAILTAAPHADAQFRRVGWHQQPQIGICQIELAQLPAHLQNPRSLRRHLENVLEDPSDLGDLVVAGDQACLALTEPAELIGLEPAWTARQGWLAQEPPQKTASVAALRLDALQQGHLDAIDARDRNEPGAFGMPDEGVRGRKIAGIERRRR